MIIRRLNYIDLFAGAGGLSEGFFQSGFQPIGHVEMNAYAAKTLETRVAYHYLKENDLLQIYYDYEKGKIDRSTLLSYIPKLERESVIQKEMSVHTMEEIYTRINSLMSNKGIEQVDVVIGGPPCQAYSLVGRAQTSHMLVPMDQDPRNELYKLYVQFLKKYKPKMFVFENVAGIKTARGGQAFRNLQMYIRRIGYELEYQELNASDFGVLQSRKRVVIIGWLKELQLGYPKLDFVKTSALVNDLLVDLPSLHPGDAASYYQEKNFKRVRNYLKKENIREKEDVLTAHIARPHTNQDIEIYKRTIELWFKDGQHKRLRYDDLPDRLKTHRNRNSFVDRFKVVEADMGCCHTILAHLSKDGHYFIHPSIEQHRSITVREAARIQSFPDNYFFEGPRTAQFVQVGNAVPPVMAKGIASCLMESLNTI